MSKNISGIKDIEEEKSNPKPAQEMYGHVGPPDSIVPVELYDSRVRQKDEKHERYDLTEKFSLTHVIIITHSQEKPKKKPRVGVPS